MAFERTEGGRPARPMRRGRKKVCSFCVDRIDHIDYKDVPRLRKYVSERAKIIPRRVTGTCAFHQRELTVAITRARKKLLISWSQFRCGHCQQESEFLRALPTEDVKRV